MKKMFFLLAICFSFTNILLAQSETKGYKVGEKIADFNLKNVDGTFKSLKDYKNEKGLIIVFTCNHCPYSIAYEDRIIALHNKYAAQGFPVVAINPNDAKAYPLDSYENMIERANEKAFPFAYLHDESQEVAKTFGATNTPHVYIVTNEKDGFVIRYIGAIDDNSHEPENAQKKYIENAISDLSLNKPVATSRTKAIGCSIKWKK